MGIKGAGGGRISQTVCMWSSKTKEKGRDPSEQCVFQYGKLILVQTSCYKVLIIVPAMILEIPLSSN